MAVLTHYILSSQRHLYAVHAGVPICDKHARDCMAGLILIH